MTPPFEEVFRAELPALHRYLRRRVGTALADDIAAETLAIAYRLWDRFDAERPVRPWLYGIASNLARRHRRQEERMLRAFARTGVDPVISDDDAAAARADASALSRTLAAELAALRSRDREILLLRAWADLGDEEIAAALSIPVGTVKSGLHRARQRLRNRIVAGGQPLTAWRMQAKEQR